MNTGLIIVLGIIVLLGLFLVISVRTFKKNIANYDPKSDSKNLVILNDNTFNHKISGKIALVDFWAEWCQPCKMMPPILKQVKQTMGDKIRILKVDVDKNPAISRKYMIQNVPTLMIFRKGEVLFRQAGVVPAAQLTDIVKRFI